MEPVYIVASFHRSGSSMMMRCLEAGGITCAYDTTQDVQNIVLGGSEYQPNPNGFYAYPDDSTFDWPTFHETFKGRAIKVPRMDLFILPQGKYKLIFMTRNPEEIRASMMKFSSNTSWGKPTVATYFYDTLKDGLMNYLVARTDFEILEINYRDVVTNPTQEFQKIKDFGFNIDIEKSVAMVDPTLYRLRLEK